MMVTVSVEGGTKIPGDTGLERVTLKVRLLSTKLLGMIGTSM